MIWTYRSTAWLFWLCYRMIWRNELMLWCGTEWFDRMIWRWCYFDAASSFDCIIPNDFTGSFGSTKWLDGMILWVCVTAWFDRMIWHRCYFDAISSLDGTEWFDWMILWGWWYQMSWPNDLNEGFYVQWYRMIWRNDLKRLKGPHVVFLLKKLHFFNGS